MEMSFFAVFLAGLASFLSPCVVPLASGYITYITGAMVESELEGKRLFALKRTILFVSGFTLVFIILGVTASSLGYFLNLYRDIFTKIGGVLLIIIGLSMLGLFKLRITGKQFKLPVEVESPFSSFLVGMIFGIGWTPCVGAILGSVLIYASSSESLFEGGLLLFFYSLGLSIPFLISSIFIDRIGKVWKSAGKYTNIISKIMGILIIVIGIMMVLDKLSIFVR